MQGCQKLERHWMTLEYLPPRPKCWPIKLIQWFDKVQQRGARFVCNDYHRDSGVTGMLSLLGCRMIRAPGRVTYALSYGFKTCHSPRARGHLFPGNDHVLNGYCLKAYILWDPKWVACISLAVGLVCINAFPSKSNFENFPQIWGFGLGKLWLPTNFEHVKHIYTPKCSYWSIDKCNVINNW